MKTKGIICLSALIGVILVGYWFYSHSQNLVRSKVVSISQDADWEYQIEEAEIPASGLAVLKRELQAKWAGEGWTVHSYSGAIRKENGKEYFRATLKKPKQRP